MRFLGPKRFALFTSLLACSAAGLPAYGEETAEPKPAAPAVDQNGERLPEGVVARLAAVRYAHPCPVYAWVYSPDGKTLVSHAEDQLVRFWDTADGRLAHAIEPPPVVIVPWPGQLSFSRDGRLLAVAYGSMCIRIIDVAEKKILHDIRELRPDLVRDGWQTVEFVGRGSLLLAGSETTSYWIDPETGKVKDRKHLGRFEARAPAANLAAFADGNNLLGFCRLNAFDSGSISFYAGALQRPNQNPVEAHWAAKLRGGRVIALSPDGKRIASAGAERIRKQGEFVTKSSSWHIETREVPSGKPVLEIKTVPATPLDYLAFSPDGALLVASGPQDAGVWDTASGERLTKLPASPHHLPYVFSPDGTKLSGVGTVTTIAEWDVASFARANRADR